MKKIALALGGGGFKGFAHIGVIRQLQKSGFEIASVAGTSIGGIVGGLFARGYSADEMQAFAGNLKTETLFTRRAEDAPALMGLGGMYDLLDRTLGASTFADLKIPFACTAVDSTSGREVILNSGSLVDALQATSAIPGIFPSKTIGSITLVDGGVLDPVPVALARWLNSSIPTVAVVLSPERENWASSTHTEIPPYAPIPPFILQQINQLRWGKAMQVFMNSMDMMTQTIADLRLKIDRPDIIIRPALDQYSIFEMADANELAKRGEEIVKTSTDAIEKSYSIIAKINRFLTLSSCPGIKISECN